MRGRRTGQPESRGTRVPIGIVADIHEAFAPTSPARALAEFRRHSVDQVVNLGDACESALAGGRASNVVALLRDSDAIGVWGNHDFGLCFEVHDRVRQNAAPEVLDYMTAITAAPPELRRLRVLTT